MPCIDRRLLFGTALALSSWLGGCAVRLPGTTASAPVPAPQPGPSTPAPQPTPQPAGPSPSAQAPTPPRTTTPAPPTPAAPTRPPVAQAPARPRLGPPIAARNWDEFKLQAAQRLVVANPDITYEGPVPEPLLAIPVLEVELNADGSVRRIQVMRHPRQAKDTVQIAIDAIHRAAPYGSMARLPLPWKWAEVFLFNDQRRFKPRLLDQ